MFIASFNSFTEFEVQTINWMGVKSVRILIEYLLPWKGSYTTSLTESSNTDYNSSLWVRAFSCSSPTNYKPHHACLVFTFWNLHEEWYQWLNMLTNNHHPCIHFFRATHTYLEIITWISDIFRPGVCVWLMWNITTASLLSDIH